jgi:hypothetical protein
MFNNKIFERSIELIRIDLEETSKDEINNLKSDVIALNIGGPTFDEYLSILQTELENIQWKNIYTGVRFFDLDIHSLGKGGEFLSPLIPMPELSQSKKDSVINTESFLFV